MMYRLWIRCSAYFLTSSVVLCILHATTTEECFVWSLVYQTYVALHTILDFWNAVSFQVVWNSMNLWIIRWHQKVIRRFPPSAVHNSWSDRQPASICQENSRHDLPRWKWDMSSPLSRLLYVVLLVQIDWSRGGSFGTNYHLQTWLPDSAFPSRLSYKKISSLLLWWNTKFACWARRRLKYWTQSWSGRLLCLSSTVLGVHGQEDWDWEVQDILVSSQLWIRKNRHRDSDRSTAKDHPSPR